MACEHNHNCNCDASCRHPAPSVKLEHVLPDFGKLKNFSPSAPVHNRPGMRFVGEVPDGVVVVAADDWRLKFQRTEWNGLQIITHPDFPVMVYDGHEVRTVKIGEAA